MSESLNNEHLVAERINLQPKVSNAPKNSQKR